MIYEAFDITSMGCGELHVMYKKIILILCSVYIYTLGALLFAGRLVIHMNSLLVVGLFGYYSIKYQAFHLAKVAKHELPIVIDSLDCIEVVMIVVNMPPLPQYVLLTFNFFDEEITDYLLEARAFPL